MYKIMLVEDDDTIRGVIKRQLIGWGYIVDEVSDFQKVTEKFCEFSPHLVLMDIGLPFFNGFYWCSEIRKQSQTPIIFLSSASDNMSLVMAINMGADDFVAKPFDLEVLTAKIGAVLRRTYSFGGEVTTESFADVTLNLGENTLIYGLKKLELTKNEFKIMESLLKAKGNIVPRDEIIKKLWDNESFIDDNTLTVNITRLRKKMAEIDLEDFIYTKKGVGYGLLTEETSPKKDT
ncbi:MAG: response regulator transcription factor [Oscillospiraceae bacterium]